MNFHLLCHNVMDAFIDKCIREKSNSKLISDKCIKKMIFKDCCWSFLIDVIHQVSLEDLVQIILKLKCCYEESNEVVITLATPKYEEKLSCIVLHRIKNAICKIKRVRAKGMSAYKFCIAQVQGRNTELNTNIFLYLRRSLWGISRFSSSNADPNMDSATLFCTEILLTQYRPARLQLSLYHVLQTQS